MLAFFNAVVNYLTAVAKEREARVFASKAEVYTELIEALWAIFVQSQRGKGQSQQDNVLNKIQAVLPKVFTWAGSGVVKQWSHLHQLSLEYKSSPADSKSEVLIDSVLELMCAIRKDLGHNDPEDIKESIRHGMFR